MTMNKEDDFMSDYDNAVLGLATETQAEPVLGKYILTITATHSQTTQNNKIVFSKWHWQVGPTSLE